MVADDPEKRIAELEGQGGYSSPPRAWSQPSDAPETTRSRKPIRIRNWLAAILFIGLGLYFLSFSARQFYGYEIGTPTTATGIECREGVPGANPGAPTSATDFELSEGCTAHWSIDGRSQTGPIVGVQHLGSADVHVNAGTAFTPPFSSWFFGGHLLAVLFVLAGLAQFWDVSRLWKWMLPRRR